MLFEKVIGNQNIKELFFNALKSEKLGNAYIFSGASGIGKKLFAIELAKAINCKKEGIKLPCNDCPECLRIENGNFPDLLFLKPEANQIKIHQIRNLIKETSLLPYEAKKRVVIIDDAHLMNISASNTFLKTLEDSSPYSIFILISSAAHNLPPTILSRCQTVKFSPLAPGEITKILDEKKIPFDINIISNLASGSVSNAITLSEKFHNDIMKNIYTSFAGLCLPETEKIFEFTETLTENFESLTDILIIFKIFFLDLIRYKLKQNIKLYNQDQKDFSVYQETLRSFADKNPLSVTFKKFGLLNGVEKRLKFNVNKKLATEGLVLELLS
jgi:DNA polymerase III subunit delta'